MVDCNFLKKTNDTLGHTWGDTLLQRTADALRASAPETATVMRIGGDEFLIVCPNTDHESAALLIKRAKEELALRSDETLTLSASFGSFAVESGAEVAFQKACKEADKAMYQEKQEAHRGKNAADSHS